MDEILFSIVIPVFNEERDIKRCLDSIAKQILINNIEVLIIDDNSTDKTLEIARQYKFVRILKSGFKDPEISKKIALDNASGSYFIYTDADMIYCDENFLETMLKPLERHIEVAGVLARFVPADDMNALTRMISYDPFQRDAFLQLFTPSIKQEEGADFYEFSKDFMPCQSLILYRTEILKEVLKGRKHFMDNDVVALCVKNGYKYFSFPPKGNGVYHYYFNNLGELWHKRMKGVVKSYLPNIDNREYKWIDLKKNWFKLGCWTIWATLFIPELIRGIFKSVKYRDKACLYQPVVSFMITYAMIFGVLRSGVSIKKVLKKI